MINTVTDIIKTVAYMATVYIAAVCLVTTGVATTTAESPEFPPECPQKGTWKIVEDPAAFADQCFKAVTGRMPNAEIKGETAQYFRDIDLDGSEERLEVRGVGQRAKQIFVFKRIDNIFKYMGELHAHPHFFVGYNHKNQLVIINYHRIGAETAYLEHIKYINNEFVVTQREQVGKI